MFSLRKRMQKGDLVVGLMISELRNPNFVYMLALSGYDFFIIDNERAYPGSGIRPLRTRPGGEIKRSIARMVRESISDSLRFGRPGLSFPRRRPARSTKPSGMSVHAKLDSRR